MSSQNPRKRPAPGASPVGPLQQVQPSHPPSTQDQVYRWNGSVPDPNTFVDPSRNFQSYMMSGQGQYGAGFPQPSTAIARRQPNRALVSTAPRTVFDAGVPESWAGFGDDPGLLQTPSSTNASLDEHDSVELLEERAQIAKREAQSKRKQIPPFVQKLSSFLEEQKNTDLIRWSDKGDSFIVLDEDEFAKTLIPELFKHNNYASFVRQLNMYGFHKRVGLSDNSMKASERKNKSPSEYYNPFFRRGHPNLLWLINKPKSGNKSKKGKKEDGDADSEEEVGIEDMAGQSFVGPATQHVASSLAGEVVPLQKKDLQAVREQLGELQQKQRAISAAINKLNHDHNNLSTIFQNMHARHETSINAILSFLANVFRKQLEEQGAAQSVTELLASIMPNAQVPQGNVYDLSDLGDLGDFVPQQTPSSTAVSPLRRPQRLLPPIPNPGNVTAMSSPASNTSPATFNHELPSGQMGSVTELYDTPSDTTSPNYLQQELQKNPQERMMKIIQDTNAATTPSPVDLPPMGARTPVNLSNDQRDKVLSIMSGMRTPPAPVAGGAPAPAPAPAPGTLPGTTPNLRSPILPSIPRASINEIKATQQEIQALQRMQEEQDAKIEDLNQILGPLSPSGRVTPMGESGAGIPEQDYFDVNQYLNTNAFDLNFGGGDYNVPDPGPVDGNDYNFTLDGVFDPGAAALFGPGPLAPGVKTQEGGNTTPSPAGTEEIMRSGVDTTTPMRDNKRRRVE